MSEVDHREKCFEAHGSDCIRCFGDRPNSGEVLAHHIDGNRENGSKENLAPLCHPCHQIWHKNRPEFDSFSDFLETFPWEGDELEYHWMPTGDILTPTEQEILLGEADVTEKYYHVVVTRVRQRINRLGDELPAIEEHPTLGDELREVVCGDSEK